MLTFESADMTLRVELQSDPSDQVELCLQEIDVSSSSFIRTSNRSRET
jgi:hypothetical protein